MVADVDLPAAVTRLVGMLSPAQVHAASPVEGLADSAAVDIASAAAAAVTSVAAADMVAAVTGKLKVKTKHSRGRHSLPASCFASCQRSH